MQVENQADRMTFDAGTPSKAKRVSPGLGYWKRYPTFRRVLAVPPIILLSLIVGMALGYGFGAAPLVMLLAGLAALPFVWRQPLLAVYFLVMGAAAIETFSMQFPDSLTDTVPLHKPMDQMGLPVPLTPIEVMMIGLLGLVVFKRIGARLVPLQLGPLAIALGIYTLFVVYGVIKGLGAGGDPVIAVWETRSQFYPIILYLITYNLVTKPEHVRRIMWLFLGAVALKGLIGLFRLVVTLRGDLGQVTVVSRSNSLMSHEESLFFVAFLVFGLLLFIFKADRPQLKFIAYAAFPVAIALLANQRRAGIMAAILSLMVIAIIVYVQMPEKRRVLVYTIIACMLFIVPYTVAFRNSSGLFAEPARAVLSTFRPDERDAGSNEYRVLEGENVGKNIALNPITGAGYGREMEMFVPLPDLTSIFSLWAYIPHNTILWVWLRLGILGFAAFWFMVGRLMLDSTIVARNERNPYLKVMGIFTVTLVMAWIAQGLVDMGITDFRLNMVIGIFIGVTARIPRMERSVAPAPVTEHRAAQPRERKPVLAMRD